MAATMSACAGKVARAPPGEGDAALGQRLPQGLQDAAPELDQLIKEEHPVAGQGDLAGPHRLTATHEASSAHRVMGRAEGTRPYQADFRHEQPGNGVDRGDLDRLLERERRQDP